MKTLKFIKRNTFVVDACQALIVEKNSKMLTTYTEIKADHSNCYNQR